MEPSGPGLCRSRSAQCGRAGPLRASAAGGRLLRAGSELGLGPAAAAGPARCAPATSFAGPVRAPAAGTAERAPRRGGEPAGAENGGGPEELNGAGTPGGGPEPRRTGAGVPRASAGWAAEPSAWRGRVRRGAGPLGVGGAGPGRGSPPSPPCPLCSVSLGAPRRCTAGLV